jgi:hypothetical protein
VSLSAVAPRRRHLGALGWRAANAVPTSAAFGCGIEGRGVVACGVEGHGGALRECEVELAFGEMFACGIHNSVDVDAFGGWERRGDGVAEGGGGAEEGGAPLVVLSQLQDPAQSPTTIQVQGHQLALDPDGGAYRMQGT